MKYAAIVATICSLLSAPVSAALKPGAPAPAFKTQATLAGHPFTFELADALKTGPVVLYFYPAAFTSGCTVEAHEFAEATEKFNRTSYVITPDGKILYAYSAMNPDKHVQNTLAAVTKWRGEQPKRPREACSLGPGPGWSPDPSRGRPPLDGYLYVAFVNAR